MFLNDTKCAHSSRFKGKGNCHQHRVTRAAQTAVTRLISVTCFMVHALMFVRLGRRCNIGLLLSVPLKLLKLWLRLIPDTLFTPQVTVCVCAARRLKRLLLQSFWEELESRWRPFSVFCWTDCSQIGFKGQHRVLHGHVAADGRVDYTSGPALTVLIHFWDERRWARTLAPFSSNNLLLPSETSAPGKCHICSENRCRRSFIGRPRLWEAQTGFLICERLFKTTSAPHMDVNPLETESFLCVLQGFFGRLTTPHSDVAQKTVQMFLGLRTSSTKDFLSPAVLTHILSFNL